MKVVAGSVRRLLLKTLGGLDTRPTTGRVKETLFNALQPELADHMFLGLSSGSRAIGTEALNRGADLAAAIESNPKALGRIRESLNRTKLEERAVIMGCNVIAGLKRLESENYKFDIVFMDSPYSHEYEQLVLDCLSRSPMVTEETLIVIETSRETEFGWPEESGWHMIKSKECKTNKHVFVSRREQMRTIVYPGSFDPVTLSHCDIIECIVKVVDKLIIGVLNNKAKCLLFSAQGRANMLKETALLPPNVEIQSLEGLSIDFVRRSRASIVIRGPRVIADFEYELQMAQTNRVITPEIGIISLITNSKHSYLSSSTVKEIVEYEGDISKLLHSVIVARAREKLEERRWLTR